MATSKEGNSQRKTEKITFPISVYTGQSWKRAFGGEHFEEQLLVLATSRQTNRGGKERTEKLGQRVAGPLKLVPSPRFLGTEPNED